MLFPVPSMLIGFIDWCSLASWVSLSFLFIYFSKSAQFPFSSRLLNAMSAPTPIPAPSHSPTMVIAGVYSGLILDSTIIMFIDSFDLSFIIIVLFPLFSLLWSLWCSICLTDIKSIIACPTISQISHMFLALLIFPLVRLFHIIIHALFKSLLFLLAGSSIHVQSNHQSIYKMKLNNSLIKILFLSAPSVLIFSFSKEAILHSNLDLRSAFLFVIGSLGGLFTTMHSSKIYIYCFYLSYYFIPQHQLYSSFILPMLTISSILQDQCLDCCIPLSSFSSIYNIVAARLARYALY